MFCGCCTSADKGTSITEVPPSTAEVTGSNWEQFDALIQAVQMKASRVKQADAKETNEPQEPHQEPQGPHQAPQDAQEPQETQKPQGPQEPQEPKTVGFSHSIDLDSNVMREGNLRVSQTSYDLGEDNELNPDQVSESQHWNQVDSAGYLLNGMRRAFMVNIRRDCEVLGLELDVVDGFTGMVTRVKDGVAKTWNEQNPDKPILVGDRIIEVNGTSGLAQDFLGPLRNDNLLSITLERASIRRVNLVKGGRALGMDILYTASAASLLVKRLTAGVVQDWNTANHGREVREGDRIVQVNGIIDPSKLLAEIQNVEELHMLCYCYG